MQCLELHAVVEVFHRWRKVPLNITLQQARQSHEFFHQSAKMLKHQFGLVEADARGIVQTCADCQQHSGGLASHVNPWGTGPLEVWQMDVTHVPEFRRQKYVHMSVDCFLLVVWATAQTGESSRHVQCLGCAIRN